MTHGRVLLVVACLSMVGCRQGGQAPSSAAARTNLSAAPAGDCQPAPGWVAARLEETLSVRGATLSRLYVGRAANVSGGPGEVRSDIFRKAWWVAAMISGVGARPQVGVWLVSGLEQGGPGLRAIPADVVAQRYSATAPLDEPFSGDGFEAVRSCVGTPPEP